MYNKLPKFAAKSAAGTNTHWASPNNVRICPLAFMVDSGHEYTLNDVRMLLKSHSINYQGDERPPPQKKPLVETIMKKYKVMRKQLKDYDSK
jgi:hypothetical protein